LSSPFPTSFATAAWLVEMLLLLARLIEVLLPLLLLSGLLLTLKSRRLHAAAAAIRFHTSLVAVAVPC
jgi:hypothetical protein